MTLRDIQRDHIWYAKDERSRHAECGNYRAISSCGRAVIVSSHGIASAHQKPDHEQGRLDLSDYVSLSRIASALYRLLAFE